MLAALNHPHIGAIYGLEHVDGSPALVLELVEGETLAERIARGPLAARRRAHDRASDRRCTGSRARARHRPSRPETREHRNHPCRRRESPRFRPRETRCARDRRPGTGPGRLADDDRRDARGRDPRQRRLHEPGAGAGSSRRQTDGYLGVRLRALRDADRRPRLRWGRALRHTGRGVEGRARCESRTCACTRAGAALPREGSEAAAAGHRRCHAPARDGAACRRGPARRSALDLDRGSCCGHLPHWSTRDRSRALRGAAAVVQTGALSSPDARDWTVWGLLRPVTQRPHDGVRRDGCRRAASVGALVRNRPVPAALERRVPFRTPCSGRPTAGSSRFRSKAS